MAFVRYVMALYQAQRTKRPLCTQCATAAALYTVGDIAAQHVAMANSENGSDKQYDWYRTATMTSIGGCALGPTMAVWYRFLQIWIQLPSKLASTVARVTADQFIFAPTSIVGLFTLVQLVKSTLDSVYKRLELSQRQVESNFTNVLVQNYKLWPGRRLERPNPVIGG